MNGEDSLIPNPLASFQQAERFYCLDIGGLEDAELTDELNYLRAHLWGLPSVHWARERVFRLEEEIKHRGIVEKRMIPSPTREKLKMAEGIKV